MEEPRAARGNPNERQQPAPPAYPDSILSASTNWPPTPPQRPQAAVQQPVAPPTRAPFLSPGEHTPAAAPGGSGSLRRRAGNASLRDGTMNASVGTTAAVVKPTVASNHLTWFVVLPLFLFILLTATVNPQMAAAVTAVVLLLTTVYAAVSDRPTWARFTRRRETILPMIFSTIILTATLWLPTTPITNAQVFTDMPEISETQAQEIKTGWTTIDPRFEPMDPILLKGLAAGICRHDLEPRSPDQAVLDTQVTLRFEDGEPLTASQARAAVDVVRNVFCGQPGDRGAVLESELMFSPAGVWKWIQTLTS